VKRAAELAPAPAGGDLVRDPKSSQNPEILLTEANRLAWVVNPLSAFSVPLLPNTIYDSRK
jgi:hypothetical protein